MLGQLGMRDQISQSSVDFGKAWIPDRSNCPELNAVVEDLIRSVPVEWRARASNIFVGRVVGGEVNATAWSHQHAGIVEIDLQFTYAVEGYVAAFDEYMSAVRGAVGGVIDGSLKDGGRALSLLRKRFDQPWHSLANSQDGWMDPTVVKSWNVDLLKSVRARRHVLDEAVYSCEAFVVAHELAHHLLGHTNSSLPRNIKADKAVRDALGNQILFDIVSPLNSCQKQEAHADILAYVILARAVDRTPSFAELYRAHLGSILSLTAFAHLTGNWVELDGQASHPGYVDRFRMVDALTEIFSAGRGRGEIGDHPLGLAAQLHGFVSTAVADWFSRRFPGERHPHDLLGVVSWLLDQGVEASAKLDAQGT